MSASVETTINFLSAALQARQAAGRRVDRSTAAMSVITMDPALRKLLDELPADDPDKEPMAEVWIALCDQRCMVPLNTPTEVDFGEWYGPPMPLNDVLIHARIGESRGCTHWDAPADAWVAPRCRITATITVRTC